MIAGFTVTVFKDSDDAIAAFGALLPDDTRKLLENRPDPGAPLIMLTSKAGPQSNAAIFETSPDCYEAIGAMAVLAARTLESVPQARVMH